MGSEAGAISHHASQDLDGKAHLGLALEQWEKSSLGLAWAKSKLIKVEGIGGNGKTKLPE